MDDQGDRIIHLNPNQIKSSHGRKAKKGKKVKRLARSIGANGIIQPPIVTLHGDGEYILVAGERRVEAAKEAGLRQVPCLLKIRFSALISIAENQDRVDLDPIEKAEAYARGAVEMGSQKALAKKIQKSESSVSTTLSLLNLHPAIIAKHRNDGVLCEKQLLQIPLGSLEDQQEAYDRIINLKHAKNSGGKPGGQDLVRKKADLLANAIMRLDPKKVGSAELADICVRVFSIIGLIASYLAKTPSVDPNAVSEVIRTASFSLKQTTERLDLSQVNTNDLNRAFQWSIEILKCIANWTLQFENERIYLCGEIFFLKNQARHMSRKLNSEVHLKSPHI